MHSVCGFIQRTPNTHSYSKIHPENIMNIFIDVGGHHGETLNELFSLPHRFDVVHCLEPQSRSFSVLESKFAAQVAAGELVLHNFGLADFDGESVLYGGEDCSYGASLFADKVDIDGGQTENCRFVKASDFVKETVHGDGIAVMNLNCEGGEALILRDLMQGDALRLLDSVYVDFDVRKIPSQAAEETKIIAEMRALRYDNYMTRNELQTMRVWSFVRCRKISRKISGRGFQRVKMWLFQIENADKIIDLGIAGNAVRYLPKSVWGRFYRTKRILAKVSARK